MSETTEARAIEAKIEAKLREQEPVAWFDKDMCILFEEDRESSKEILIKMGWKPVFTNPAPIPEGWISVGDRLPEDETPVLIIFNGEIVIGERRWDNPGFEDTYKAFWYWDDPTDDGQDWGRDEVTHWMPLPKPPMAAARSGE